MEPTLNIDSQRILDLNLGHEFDSSSDSETISKIGEKAFENQRTAEATFEQKIDDSIPENETKISLLGRIRDGFKAAASKVGDVIKLIASVVKKIIVTPFTFVASLFITVGQGLVKAGQGIINFAGAVLSCAKKTVVSAAKCFASAVKSVAKNRIVQCAAVIALIVGITMNDQKIENAVRNIPKLF